MMRIRNIVRIVLIDLAALLLPLFLGIPSIPLNLETLVSLGGGLAVFYLITGLTARKGWRRWIFLMPLTLLVVMAISYIPFTLSGWQLVGYYGLVIVAMTLSVGSHLLGSCRPRRRRHEHEEEEWDEDDE